MAILGGQRGRIAIERAPAELGRASLLDALARRIEEAGGLDVVAAEGEVTFRGGPFRSPGSWRALAAVSSGRVLVDRGLRAVSYHLGFGGLLGGVAAVTAVVAGLALADGQLRLAALSALLWPALVGLGTVTASSRFDRLLRGALEAAGCELGR